MSTLTMRLQKLQRAYNELETKTRAVQCVWQVVTRDSEFLRELQDFSPVNIHRKPADLPETEDDRIRLLNQGKVLLLGGVLRLFVIPDEMDVRKVEILLDRLGRKYGTDRAALYAEAAHILFRGQYNE